VSNDFGAGGMSVDSITKIDLVVVHDAVHPVHYVSPSGGHVTPFMSWADAATNIDAAVFVASPGDTVRATDGVYRCTTDVGVSKGVTVISVNGARHTAVTRGGAAGHRLFTLSHSNAVLDGFTISNGYVSGTAEPGGYGGGVLIFSNGTVRNCIIAANTAKDADGGGVCCWAGGLVRNCVLAGNYGKWSGGLDLLYGGLVENSTIISNTAAYQGGGIRAFYGGLARNCLIVGNACGWQAGGIYTEEGAGIYNCTIVSNSAPQGSGIVCWNVTPMRNCIIWGNSGSESLSGTPVFVSHNCIQGWTNLSAGTISNYPDFLDRANGNYRLRYSSPCRDTGTNMGWMVGATDRDGYPRIAGPTVDMGAYELGQLICGFDANPTVGTPLAPLQFTGWAAGTNAFTVYYRWDFERDGTYDVEGLSSNTPTWYYDTEGTYSVALLVSNAAGVTAERVKDDYVVIVPEPCGGMAAVVALLCAARRRKMRG
jgi:hypothetical protein